MSYPIAFDFDGVCAENVGAPAIGAPIREVLDLIVKLRAEGRQVVIYSHRPRPGQDVVLRNWLRAQGVEVDAVITHKILYSVFVDDRAVEYPRAAGDLAAVIAERLK